MTRARRTALLVMGMHRSGTSALTGVIGLMGADLPNDLMAASDLNAKGFFESNRITSFDEDLLASAGFTWWDCRRFPAEWFSSPRAGAFARRAADELAAEYGDSALFVLKDPRICRLAPFWLPVLRDTGCRTLVILPLRHPRDVAASLEHRAGYDPDYGLLMWLRHVLDAEAETRGTRRVFTSYEALMTDWSAEIRRIGEGLGLSWPRSVSVARPEIDAFLSRDLQHFARTGVERAATTALPVLVRKTYEILTTWAREGERPSDHGRLDKLREDGVLRGTQARINWRALGYAVHVSLRVTLDKTAARAFDDFLALAREVPEVIEIQTFLGRVDVRLSLVGRDLAHYQDIYRTRILTLPHIADIEALMTLSTVKHDLALPL